MSAFDLALRRLGQATHRLRALPVLVLMPHSRCNCRCVMCDIWRANRDRQELSAADLEPHLEDLRRLRVRWVVLSGGEALMHSNLWALCERLKELGVRISLLSTGLLLARDAEQIARRCDDVIVSLDGPREVHDAIRRVPRAYDKLAAGVAALHRQAPGFPVTARCVVQRANYRDLPGVVAAAHDLGLDQVSFLAADVSSQAFNRPRPWGEERAGEVALSGAEADELASALETLIADRGSDFDAGFIAESPERLRDLGRYFLALAGRGELPAVRCNAPWVSAVIEADGSVRPCFFHRPYGDLKQASLGEILSSEEAVAFRRRLDVARDPTCRRCVCTLNL